MAHIEVRPARRGIPWWAWLLLALLIGALVFFLLIANGDDPDDVSTAGTDSTEVTPSREVLPTPVEPPYQSVNEIPTDGSAVSETDIGRSVIVSEARVTRVVGDSAFYVATEAGREVLVALDEGGASVAGSARGFDVSEGDVVGLRGRLRRASDAVDDLPQAVRSGLAGAALYVAASATDVRAAVDDAMEADTSAAMTIPDTTTTR